MHNPHGDVGIVQRTGLSVRLTKGQTSGRTTSSVFAYTRTMLPRSAEVFASIENMIAVTFVFEIANPSRISRRKTDKQKFAYQFFKELRLGQNYSRPSSE